MMARLQTFAVDNLIFAVVCLVSAIVGLVVAYMTRSITIYGADHLNQVAAARRAGEWRWLSDMHKCGKGKTRMKDAVVLGLAIMQRLLGDRTGGHPLVVLCLVANSVSAVLIFLVASAYWSPAVGLLLWALFVTSFWPYLNALYGGHICTAQMFFLASVYSIHQAGSGLSWQTLAWYLVAGAAIGFMLFSSSSSRKYFPLLAGGFIYSQRTAVAPAWLTRDGWEFVSGGTGIVVACSATVLALGLAFIYLRHRRVLRTLCIAVSLYLIASLALSRSAFFYVSQFSIALGIGVVILLFTYPDVIVNLRSYYAYWNAGKYYGHFRLCREYFARIGKPIREDMRGAGLQWIVRYFWRIAPFHVAYAVLSLCVLVIGLFLNGFGQGRLWGTIGIVCLSVSPVLVGEMTRGLQLGRTYFPAFAGLLLLIGYTVFQVGQLLPPSAGIVLWSVSSAVVLIGATWNLWVFLDDVWPARMAPAWLAEKLSALGVKEFYTYNTPYTNTFLWGMWKEHLENYEVQFIKTLQEIYDVRFIKTLQDVREGYVIVPGTSGKAVNMDAHPYTLEHGDFEEDPFLNRLIDSRAITRYAVASFKTLGSSRMWVHESEVASYRDLILGEVSEYDRWRAKAWILDAGKLHADGSWARGAVHQRQG